MTLSATLGVNIDHVATLRQARGTIYPDPVNAAQIAEQSGADSITLHLREDPRHIQTRDALLEKLVVQAKINLEIAVTPEMLVFACELSPQDVCLVPEMREELTTEGGLDVAGQIVQMREACALLANAGIRVSPFIDASFEQIDAVVDCGASCVEIHTGQYAEVHADEQQMLFDKIVDGVNYAHDKGLQVNAGHGLNYHNAQAIAAIEQVTELNLGHAIVADAVFNGLSGSVREMKRLIVDARA
jgi:pyridoxine 5-phosphate synthase